MKWYLLLLIGVAAAVIVSPPVFLCDGEATLTDAYGVLTDDLFGPYQPNQGCVVTIAPDMVAGEVLTVLFTVFDTEDCCDTLRVDANNGSDPIVWAGEHLSIQNITSSGPIVITFQADSTIQRDGFIATWAVIGPAREAVSSCPPNSCSDAGACIPGWGNQCLCDLGHQQGDCSDDDSARLFSFYTKCGGPHWLQATGWTLAQPVCTGEVANWAGVNCYAHRANQFNMPANNLRCQSTPLLNFFPRFTENVDLSHNPLVTAIPADLNQYTVLSTFVVVNGSLSGIVPTTVGSLPALRVLDLADNLLTGPIFSTVTRLVSLVRLSLERNMLHGHVPDALSLLPDGSIFLAGNKLWCPAPNWPALATVDCINVTVSGVSPSLAPDRGGANITITGENFPTTATGVRCHFGNQDATSSLILSETTATCIAPPSFAGATGVSLHDDDGAVSINSAGFTFQITCPKDSYLADAYADSCVVCPDGAVCVGGLEAPYAAPGYAMSESSPLIFLKCFVESACPGGPGRVCAEGYQGPRCSQCDADRHMVSGECTLCTTQTSAVSYLLLIILPLALCGFFFYGVTRIQRKSSMAIIVLCVQMVGGAMRVPMHWPAQFEFTLMAFSVFNVNLEVLGLGCSLRFDHWQAFSFFLAIPFILAGIIALICVVAYYIIIRDPSLDPTLVKRRQRDHFLEGCLLALEFMHVPLTQSSMAVLNCVSDVDRSYLLDYPSETCYTPHHKTYIPLAIAGLVIYGAGIPVLFLTVMLSSRKNLEKSFIAHRFGTLFLTMQPNAWYFKVFTAVWVIFIVALPVIFRDSPVFMSLIRLTLFIFYVVSVLSIRPFKFKRNNFVSPFMMMGAVFVTVAGIVFYSDDLSAGYQMGITVFVVCYLALALVVGLHGFLYEVQFYSFDWLAQNKFAKRFVNTATYKTIFPEHDVAKTNVKYLNGRTVVVNLDDSLRVLPQTRNPLEETASNEEQRSHPSGDWATHVPLAAQLKKAPSVNKRSGSGAALRALYVPSEQTDDVSSEASPVVPSSVFSPMLDAGSPPVTDVRGRGQAGGIGGSVSRPASPPRPDSIPGLPRASGSVVIDIAAPSNGGKNRSAFVPTVDIQRVRSAAPVKSDGLGSTLGVRPVQRHSSAELHPRLLAGLPINTSHDGLLISPAVSPHASANPSPMVSPPLTPTGSPMASPPMPPLEEAE